MTVYETGDRIEYGRTAHEKAVDEERALTDTALLEACREALHGALFYVDEMAERVLGQPKEMLPDKRLATARSTIKQLEKRLKGDDMNAKSTAQPGADR